jgi:predicted nuclease of restriction endonuclease-like (RecB) superfamily
VAQTRAALSANAEMILLYWDIGRMIAARQEQEGWGKGLLSRLATDLKNEIPEIKGFSERNLQLMIQFQSEYPSLFSIPKRPVAELPQAAQSTGNGGLTVVRRPAGQLTQGDPSSIAQRVVAQLSWGHNVILIQKVKDLATRLWYARQALEQGWSRDSLAAQIRNRAHERQ